MMIKSAPAAVTCEAPGRIIDLGGIGKGFALDRLHQLLVEWGATSGLLCSGASTILAFGPEEWPVDLTTEHDRRRILLRGRALAASGTGIQGSHIVHPHAEEGADSYHFPRLWVVAQDAARGDAWSTAVMLMEPAEAGQVVGAVPAVEALYVERDGKVEPV